MKRIAVFNVKNQDTLLDIALTLGAMNETNKVISSWTAHTKYLLPEPVTHHKAHKGHLARSILRHHWEDQERQS